MMIGMRSVGVGMGWVYLYLSVLSDEKHLNPK